MLLSDPNSPEKNSEENLNIEAKRIWRVLPNSLSFCDIKNDIKYYKRINLDVFNFV